MKARITTFLITLTLITQIVYSQSGWINCSPNSSKYFCSVDFINENTGYVLDFAGFVFKTTNAGNNWVQTCGLIYDVCNIDFINEQTGFICGDNYCSIMKSTNGGYNWEVKTLVSQYLYDIDFLNNSTGFAVGDYGPLLKTTNAGENWIQMQFPQSYWNTAIQLIDSSVMFVVGYSILRSVNGGNNWTNLSFGSNFIWNLYFVNSNTGYIAGNYNIYRTNNSGDNWSLIRNDVNNYRGIFFQNENTGYICGSGEILKTINSGMNWQIQFADSTVSLNSVIFVNGNTGFCVGDYGTILKTTTGGEPIGIQPISTEIPKQFILHQNYPNPFNPVTKIKFSIPLLRGVSEGRGVLVRLIIYDILGREVAVLVNEQLNAGVYEVNWSATGGGTNFSSGVYFYRLIISDASAPLSITKKMVLIK